jgi:hypothetical protein
MYARNLVCYDPTASLLDGGATLLRGSEDTPLNNLPRQLTSFVGRERELAEVQRLLPVSPFLTLTGTGGFGKTRLAVQAAENSPDAYPGSIWFVELGPLADAALVPEAVAAVLGYARSPGAPSSRA